MCLAPGLVDVDAEMRVLGVPGGLEYVFRAGPLARGAGRELEEPTALGCHGREGGEGNNRRQPPAAGRGRQRAAGFTLIELTVTVSIVAVLLAILLPGMALTVGAARGFRCQVSQRSVVFDFHLFADDALAPSRGDDDQTPGRFRLETFQESLYGVSEFWRWGDVSTYTVPDASGFDPLRCSEVHGALTLSKGLPCSGGAVSPPQHVSYGFNARLHRAEVINDWGVPAAVLVYLNATILGHESVPLVWDVDGERAFANGVSPVFSAPALDSQAVYADNRYWFPGLRHNGSVNVGFVGGHVLASPRPLDELEWSWGYQPVE